MEIGKRLKQKRQEANLTQKELSEILHVSRQTVSSWEVGRTYPDLEILVAISELYDTPLDDLLKEDSQMVKDITKKVKKSERRKMANIILACLLIIITGTGMVYAIQEYQNNQANDYGLKPNDLLGSTWSMSYSPIKDLSQSSLSFDSNSLIIWNRYFPAFINPSVDPEKINEMYEEWLEKGLEDGLVTYKDLTVEVEEDTYIVSGHGYIQEFVRLSDKVIRDSNGTEYFKNASVSSHDVFNNPPEELENDNQTNPPF